MTDFGEVTEERLKRGIEAAAQIVEKHGAKYLPILDRLERDTEAFQPRSLSAPRFMTDQQLRAFFGLSERALTRLRMTTGFPRKDALVNRTDRKAVDRFFDIRAGIAPEQHNFVVEDGHENFERKTGRSRRRGF